MPLFQSLSIKRKLIWIMLTSGAVLWLAWASLVTWDQVKVRSNVRPLGVSTKDKASLVALFLKSTDWPAETFSGEQTPLILGILGQNPFGVYAKLLTTNTVHRRRIEVKIFNTVEDVKECHLLFVSSSEDDNLARIQSVLQNSNVLTMGETDEFIRHGGLIKVMGLTPGEKYLFGYNKKVYERSRLKIDIQLLEFGKPAAKQ